MIAKKDLSSIFENSLFTGVDTDCSMRIFEETKAVCMEYEDGDILHSPETTEKQAGILLEGAATVTTPTPGKNTLLRFLSDGEAFGIANLFSNSPYVSVIRAQGFCRVFCIPEEAVRRLLEADKCFLYNYLAFLADRIRYLNRKIGYLTAGSAERRVALYLASLGEGQVQLDASISALSELLDVGRASLYRAFDKLTEDGYIRKEGRCFTLLNREDMLNAYR